MNFFPARLTAWVDTHLGKAATLAAWTGQGVSLISAALSVPLIMWAFGDATAGVWHFLLGWTAFFQLCDFGFSQSISRQISYANAERKGARSPGSLFLSVRGPRAIAQLYVSTKRLFRWLSFGIAVLAVVAERTVLFSGKMDASSDARVCWYLVAGMAVAINETRADGAVLTGCFQLAWLRILGALISLAQNTAFIIALALRAPLWAAGAIFFAGSLLQCVATRRLRLHRCPLPAEPRPKRAVLRAIWAMSWQQGVATTSAWFIFSVNPMLVGYWLGKPAVNALAIPTRMAMLLFAMLGEIAAPQLNFMVRLVGERDVPGLLRKFFLALLFTAVPGLAAYGVMAAIGIPFIQWWTLGRVSPDFATLGWLALYCWLALVQLQAACFVTAHGRQPFALAAVIGALLNVGLACVLLPRLGLAGAPLATFLAQLVTSNWYALWLAAMLLAGYARATPGVVAASFRNAVHEVFTFRIFKSLLAR